MISTRRQFGRFIVAGIGNTIFGYGFYALLIYAGVHYLLASLFSTIAGVLFNFFTTGRWVFHNKDNTKIAKFCGVYAAVYLFHAAGLTALNNLQLNLYFAGVAVVIPAAVLSFLLNRRFVFGGKP